MTTRKLWWFGVLPLTCFGWVVDDTYIPDMPQSWYDGSQWYARPFGDEDAYGGDADNWYLAELNPPAISPDVTLPQFQQPTTENAMLGATLDVPELPVDKSGGFGVLADQARKAGNLELASAYSACQVNAKAAFQADSRGDYQDYSNARAAYHIAYANAMNILLGNKQRYPLEPFKPSSGAKPGDQNDPDPAPGVTRKDGDVLFYARTAKYDGAVDYSPDEDATTQWMLDGAVSWPETPVRPGAYDVYGYFRVPPNGNGGQFEIDIDGVKVSGKTHGDGKWQTVRLGHVELKEAKARVEMRSLGGLGNLMWLRGLVLKPSSGPRLHAFASSGK